MRRLPLALSGFILSFTWEKSLLAAKFQMLKKGEWNMELVESSLGPLAQGIKTKPFCIDGKTESWEERAKEAMKKAGLDCQLKTLKDEAELIKFETDCKAAADQKQNNPLITSDTKFNGQVTVTRINENEYRLDQDAVGTGVKLPDKQLASVPAGQRKMLESMLGIQEGKIKLSMKQKYTFSKADCSTQ